MDDIIAIVRALVVSQKDININDIGRDFYQLEGYTIPFKKYGFNRLENFLESSGEFFINRINGEQRISVKKSDSSAHITKLVQQQKRDSKKKTKTIPQRKLRVTQNLQSYAYSDVYSKLPARSVAKHALKNRCSTNSTPQKTNINVTNSVSKSSNIKLSSSSKESSNFQLEKGKTNSSNKTVKSDINISMEKVEKCKKENMVPKPDVIVNKVTNTQNDNFAKDNTASNKAVKRMWRQNSYSQNDPKQLSVTISINSNNTSTQIKNNEFIAPTNQPTNCSPNNHHGSKSVMHRLANINSSSITNKSNDKQPISARLIVKSSNLLSTTASPTISTDPIIQLDLFCTEHSINKPQYKPFKIPQTTGIFCKVTLNGSSYSTYPNECTSELDAKKKVAHIALNSLEKSIKRVTKYNPCMDSESELVIKIYEAIKSYSSGLFSQNVPEYFENMYEQSLPNEWLQFIENSPQLFSIENTFGNRKIIYANINPSTFSSTDIVSVQDNDFQLMDKIVFPWAEKHWNIFITNPVSTVEIWGRLIGLEYSDKMDSLITDIELSLLTNKKVATKIDVGCIYLVNQSECTYRVRVDRTDLILRRCLCFFIDAGDEDWFQMDEIFVCESRFFKFPAQAICFSLYGLEDFAENSHAKHHLQETLSLKILIGDIQTTQEKYAEQEKKADELSKICVGLYDTSSDEDVCLNPIILQSICNDTKPPRLNNTGITNITITNINEKGEIYSQVHNRGIAYIEKIIHHLSKMDFNNHDNGVEPNDKRHSLYLVFDEKTQKWYRAQVKSEHNKQCLMYFVDYGIERIIDSSKLYRLDVLSGALNTYPHQAIKMKLSGITEWNENIVATLKGYLTANTTALVKVISNLSVPEVNIYKQFGKSSPLSCINEAILLEDEINNSKEIIASEIELPQFALPSKSVDGTIPYELKSCTLPKFKETFNVLVTMCSNPSNFRVCSYDNYPELHILMAKLQQHCSNSPLLINVSDVQIGQVYAGLNNDNNWYRVIIEENCNDSTVLALCCDYGELIIMSTNNLKPLPNEFRSLPKQALQASLYGIKPINNDWEIEDCLYFKEIAADKNFVSVVENIVDNKLELTLIDVSTEVDVYINQKLVLEGKANFC